MERTANTSKRRRARLAVAAVAISTATIAHIGIC